MVTPVHIKVCGLNSYADVDHAAGAGARWVGFVHFPKSPRHIEVSKGAEIIRQATEAGLTVETVLLLVNPTAEEAVELANAFGVDHIQLHGSETNDVISAIRRARPLGEIWKALPVSEAADLEAVKDFPAADRFLFDAKPPKDASRPGGLGESFDWTLLQGFECNRPWLLAGGLTPENVAEAVRITGAPGVDVSSGVEAEKGVKDASKIAAFGEAVRGN
ncbi:MAG: phosphoribosylanthranilate isomerase [Ponticaulis sp.]|nr:phosphoribosylanthranilate isomerase [Ponticaulis sp.]|tara:strand:+ start:30479 stop:31135 length:657 start_codon:yes stop_codon:yes gene_type:complete